MTTSANKKTSAHYVDAELPDKDNTYFTRYGQTLRLLKLKQVVHIQKATSKNENSQKAYVIDLIKFDPYYQLFFVKIQFKQSGGIIRLYEDGRETYGRTPDAYPKRNKRYLHIRISSYFTEQEDDYIQANYLKADNHALSWQLYSLTGLYRTDLQISSRLVILGLSRKGKDEYMYYGNWNFPMMQYLKDNYQEKDNIEIAKKLQAFTKVKMTPDLVCGRLKTMGWKRSKPINRGCFTSESRAEESADIGAVSERLHKRDGRYYKFIKVKQPNKWIPYNRFVWESEHGPIPDNHVICYKDGDTLNCDISNLECISRGELMIKNTPKGIAKKRIARKAVACRRINRVRLKRGRGKIKYRGVSLQTALNHVENVEPIGTIEDRRTGGTSFLPHIKIGQPNEWELLAHHNWKKVNERIPENKTLCYKDGNKWNCEVSNLEFLTEDEIRGRRTANKPLMQKVNRRRRDRKEKGLSLVDALLQGL